MLAPQVAEKLPGDPDPALRNELAHATARAILNRCQAIAAGPGLDPEVVRRLVTLVETEGMDTVAEVWSGAEAISLPGALWRLYLLREWVRVDTESVRVRYRLGAIAAPVAVAVVGVVESPTPADLLDLVDAVLSGFYAGDLGDALDRASAFCRILASGSAFDADTRDATDQVAARSITRLGAKLQRTADELAQAARLARVGQLE